MTNEGYKKKYPIGTRIRFTNSFLDTGKLGTIVAYRPGDNPIVYLPTADKHLKEHRYPTLPGGTKFTWKCSWDEVELVARIGEQLLFDFMNKVTY